MRAARSTFILGCQGLVGSSHHCDAFVHVILCVVRVRLLAEALLSSQSVHTRSLGVELLPDNYSSTS